MLASPEPPKHNRQDSRRRLIKWATIVGFWTFFGLLNGSQVYFTIRMENLHQPLWRSLVTNLLGWWVWIPATPIILWLGRRFPFGRESWLRVLPVHILACVLLAGIHEAWFTYLNILIHPFGPSTRSFRSLFIGRASSQFHIDLIVYAGILLSSYAVRYYFRYRERELRASQLETQLANAQLQALKMQLHPHFLFNTLNAIAGLVRDSQNKAAVEMLVGLSDLLRYTLENAGKQEVPLKEELQFVELYVDIQKMRFSDRLEVEMRIAPETLDALVPNLILQPLVENAIRHGIAMRASSGKVGINADRDGALVRIRIYDDGPGLKHDGQETVEGVGLSNTRARLAQLYGERQQLTLSERSAGGVEVTLLLPFRTAN